MTPPFVLLEGALPDRTVLFERPETIFVARDPSEVARVLAEMDEARRRGRHLAGYAAYELGYALEPKFAGLSPPTRVPLLAFGAFKKVQPVSWPHLPASFKPIALKPSWTAREYAKRFRKVQDLIRAGDAYQINLTFPMNGTFRGDPVDLYRALRLRQPVALGGVIALGGETVVSLSPEWFFQTRGRNIAARPMKGTMKRGRDPHEDARFAASLVCDEKSRAENLMIVDLIRNDLGRMSEIGSVRMTDFCTLETYPTLHQMTSGIEARLTESLTLQEVFTALFPCGSVTGAPKIRAMEIIRDLEPLARGAYCGAIGYIAPNGDMRFNVAIRTITLFKDGELVCNVGSAILADSQARAEYDECLLKACFLTGSD